MAFGQKKTAQLPENLSNLIKAVGLDPEIDKGAVWNCHGTPVILHKTLERIAESQGIMFDPPQIIEADSKSKTAVVCVNGSDGDRSAWSIGEAAPTNNKNEYPYAMAEKRAKDRVILKLIGASGFVYSEEEADSFKNTVIELMMSDDEGDDEKTTSEPDEESEKFSNAFIAEAKDKIKNSNSRSKMIAWANSIPVKRNMEYLSKNHPEIHTDLAASIREHITSLMKGS